VSGTHIATEHGEIRVEALAIGDCVQTLSGALRPIKWIGKGHALVTPGIRSAATPVIVRKGALDRGIPYRDLYITKGHSLFVDGALVPVEFLVNHRSILWDDHLRGEVTVYHIELETHDVLLAEGAPAESYRDDGNRWLFRNTSSDWGPRPQKSFAPVLTGGPIVDSVWRRLLDRTGPMATCQLTDDPNLYLEVDGEPIMGRIRPNGFYLFHLERYAAQIRVVSRASVPAQLGLARDPRRLGVALRSVRLWQGARLRLIEASQALLAEGFHLYEEDNGFRWTDGNASLPAELFDGVEGSFELELHVACTTRYPLVETEQMAA
jgi:hypothetical protein